MHETLSSKYCTERSLDGKITTPNSHFSKFHYIHLPSYITFIPIPLFTLVTQLSKSVKKNFWLIMVYWIFGTNTSCPSKAMPNEILNIMHARNKPNCLQKAVILYLASENELPKPNQCRCLEIHRLFPLNWPKTGLWLAQQTHD